MKKPANGVNAVPQGYHTVTPWIVSADTSRMLAFVRDAFGAEEIARVPNENGGIVHSETRIGNSVVMMFDGREDWPETRAFLRLYVKDCDAIYRKAIGVGATSVTEPTELAFGDRVARVRDPLGNIWWIQTHREDLDPAEIERRSAEPRYADAMKYVQDSLVGELSGRVAGGSSTFR
jgi:PhnB protein